MTTVLYILIVAAVFAGDMHIKNHMEANQPEGKTTKLWKGRILLRMHHNPGAVLNVARSRQKLVAAISVLMTVIATIFFVISLGHKGNHLLRTGLSLLLGGAFSNTYDRLKRKYVIDYFSFGVKWPPLRNIIFNLSDLCILIGALLTTIAAPQW